MNNINAFEIVDKFIDQNNLHDYFESGFDVVVFFREVLGIESYNVDIETFNRARKLISRADMILILGGNDRGIYNCSGCFPSYDFAFMQNYLLAKLIYKYKNIENIKQLKDYTDWTCYYEVRPFSIGYTYKERLYLNMAHYLINYHHYKDFYNYIKGKNNKE